MVSKIYYGVTNDYCLGSDNNAAFKFTENVHNKEMEN